MGRDIAAMAPATNVSAASPVAVGGAMDLDDVFSKRDEINQTLLEKLDQVTNRWGIRIMAVDIREVVPPRAIEEAMTRKMVAERNRRAMVAEAEGKREAAVTVARGEKRATILKAEVPEKPRFWRLKVSSKQQSLKQKDLPAHWIRYSRWRKVWIPKRSRYNILKP